MTKPWITQGIRKLIEIKIQLCSCGYYTKYKYYRNKIINLIRISKRSYFAQYFELINQNDKNIGISKLINNQKMICKKTYMYSNCT